MSASDRDQYLTNFHHWLDTFHGGTDPQAGQQNNDTHRCDDVALHAADVGLFVLADGVSDFPNSWVASREITRLAHEQLGEELNVASQNIQQSPADLSEVDRQLHHYISVSFKRLIAEADARIQALCVNRASTKAGTTFACAKCISSPNNGNDRLFFSHIGDSRIYLQRENQPLQQLTNDHRWLQHQVEQGRLSQEDHDQVDQHTYEHLLSPRLRLYARHPRRFDLMKYIGQGFSRIGDVSVYYFDIQPGDRLLMLSDGVSDQLTRKEIQSFMQQVEDDRQVEEQLIDRALHTESKGYSARARVNDVAALVHTFF